MKAFLFCLALFAGRLQTLQDEPVVRLPPHASSIPASDGGKCVEPLHVTFPSTPPKPDAVPAARTIATTAPYLADTWNVLITNANGRTATFGAPAAHKPLSPPPSAQGYHLVFADDFNTLDLSPDGKGDHTWYRGIWQQQTLPPIGNVSVSSSILSLSGGVVKHQEIQASAHFPQTLSTSPPGGMVTSKRVCGGMSSPEHGPHSGSYQYKTRPGRTFTMERKNSARSTSSRDRALTRILSMGPYMIG